MLVEGPTEGINDSTGAVEKQFSINISKAQYKILLKFTLQW